jgi:hypothetical protein
MPKKWPASATNTAGRGMPTEREMSNDGTQS